MQIPADVRLPGNKVARCGASKDHHSQGGGRGAVEHFCQDGYPGETADGPGQ